ncbi:hypothetical protein [Arthrobacter sp. TMS2-4]
MSSLNVLTFRPQDPDFVDSEFSHRSRRARRRESKRLDILIDGRPLRLWWRDWEQPEYDFDVPVPPLVTRLSRSSMREALIQLRQLRGSSPEGRPITAELFYCGECFDVSDGILGVQVSRDQSTVRWQRFGWIDDADGISEDALITNAPPIIFDTAAYDHALDDAQAALISFFRRSR